MTATLPQAFERLAGRTGPRAAAFDADGTLWRGDVSEDFARWMIARGDFDADLWAGYEQVNRLDPARGCLEILRFYRGHPLAALRQRVDEFWRTAAPRRWIGPVLEAFRWLSERGFATFVVSGTPRIVLEPLPRHLPVRPERILALELARDGAGRATGEALGTVPTGAGKAVRLRDAGASPLLFAAGNSLLDLEMLQSSELLAWAVEPDPDLRARAAAMGWPIYEQPHG